MWDVLFDGLEKLVDKLRERRPRVAFWTVVVLWAAAAALPAVGAALTGAGWFSVLIPLAPLVVVALTYWGGVEWIPTAAWVTALAFWAVIPGGLAYAAPRGEGERAGVAAFLFCYGQLLVALLNAICFRRGFPARTPFARLRLTRLRLVAAAFPLALSFRGAAGGGGSGAAASARGWQVIAEPVVLVVALAACAFPSRRKAAVAAAVVTGAAWAVLAHAGPQERWSLIGEDGWLWLSGCYQWARAARQDFWHRDHWRDRRPHAAARPNRAAAP